MSKYQPMFNEDFINTLIKDTIKYGLSIDQLKFATIEQLNDLCSTSTIKAETLASTKSYIISNSFNNTFHFINFLKKKLRNYNEVVNEH